jgi:hypothetical protein
MRLASHSLQIARLNSRAGTDALLDGLCQILNLVCISREGQRILSSIRSNGTTQSFKSDEKSNEGKA